MTTLAVNLLLFCAICQAVLGAEAGGADLEFFEKRIRPVLADNCYKCHSRQSEKVKGGLLLDSREAIVKGGDSGAAVVPGDPENSLLIKAVRYTDKDLQMPPKDKKLSERQIHDLTTWVVSGAPWPQERGNQPAAAGVASGGITDKDRAYWAFQPISRPPVPILEGRLKTTSPIDAFVRSGLAARELEPNPPAIKRELARRVYFDLIGLPPTPEQVRAFEQDPSPASYEKVVDYLLALPQYGERWGRHWLDVVRYAQSNGYERDGEKPLAWRYRDYVIKAFNEDKPYDRFVTEQLAGDELPDCTPDSIVATGFQRLGVWDDEPDDKTTAEYDELDDIISTTGVTFLGLTLGCARCHDHKFDPIPQADYYRMVSFFHNVRPYGPAAFKLDSPNYAPLATRAQVGEWEQEHATRIKEVKAKAQAATGDEGKKLQEELARIQEEQPPFEWALAVREQTEPVNTHVLIRGNARSLGTEVEPAFLTVLGGDKPHLEPPAEGARSTGRRLALARWIASPKNPLTARVMVNRLWQHHFGQGIVPTTTDFGRAGMAPTNAKLLDWLAAEFIENGWSVKKMQRLIVLSDAYRMSSRATNANAIAKDPANSLVWRQSLRRLEAETIRDTILSISGNLNPAMGGRGFFPHVAGEVIAGASRPGQDWEKSSREEQSRRSIYTYIRRTMLAPMFEAFDYSNTASPLGERPATTVAPQALMLLNNSFMSQESEVFAARLMKEAGPDLKRQISRGYQLALNHDPSAGEMKAALAFVKRQHDAYGLLASRLTFRPDVPTSLFVDYMGQLDAPDFLLGPRPGWTYYRGHWSSAYEGIRTLDRARAPFALWTDAPWTNCVIEGQLVVHRAAEFGSLLLRARGEDEEQRGYEVMFDPRAQRLLLRRHETAVTNLAEVAASIPTEQPLRVRIQLADDRIRVWLGAENQPRLDYRDPRPISNPGFFGVRTWGAALSLDHLVLRDRGRSRTPAPAFAGFLDRQGETDSGSRRVSPADQRALQSFCLLLFNLNETVYVD